MDTSKLDAEANAVRDRYSRRTADTGPRSVYNPLRLDRLLLRHRKELLIAAHLRSHWLSRISEMRVLEVGCGAGANLNMFMAFGVPPDNLTGIELLEDRVERARAMQPPGVRILQGDATLALFEQCSFDVIIQSTVFSSILAKEVRVKLARNMWDWLKPGGSVLWYDLAFDNPRNSDVAGIRRQEIRDLFPEARLEMRRVTLAPPIARRIAGAGGWLYRLLDGVPMLRSHTLGWLTKPAREM